MTTCLPTPRRTRCSTDFLRENVTRYAAASGGLSYAVLMRFLTACLLITPLPSLAAPVPQAGPAASLTGLLLIGTAFLILAVLLVGQRIRPLRSILGLRLGRRRLRRCLQKNGLYRLDSFILPGVCDGLTRVDHAVLTTAGLVCIRAKHGNGLVFGTESEPQWNCVDGVDNRQFLNPLIQNAGRAKALQKVVPDIPVTSLVVFTGTVQFSQCISSHVIHVSQLDQWLEQYQQQPARTQDLDSTWMNLRAAARTDDASQRDFEAQLSFG